MLADVNFFPARVHGGDGWLFCIGGERLQQGNGRDRFVQDLGERFDGCQTYAESGERAGAGSSGEGIDVMLGEAVFDKQSGDLENQLG